MKRYTQQGGAMIETFIITESGRVPSGAWVLAEDYDRLDALVNNPETADFLEGVRREKAHQINRWGEAHDRRKSAEAWYWLVGYLVSKALRAAIEGDHEKAKHHTISSAAALACWHDAITRDESGCGLGMDADLTEVSVTPHERALARLVYLKGLKEKIEAGTASDDERSAYEDNKEPAWQRAREVLGL